MMNKSALLGLAVETRDIPVEGSDETLRIRALSGAEMTKARKMSKGCIEVGTGLIINADMYLQYELFLTRCGLVDGDGEQMLSEDEVIELSNRRHSLIVHVAKNVAILSGLVEGELERSEKN